MADSATVVDEIMSAADAMGLFGSIGKRAAIKYRRLMRTVHPDVDPSPEAAEAASRLNALWEEWQVAHGGKPTSKAAGHAPAAKTTRVLSTTETTLFKTDDGWLEVANKPTVASASDVEDFSSRLGTLHKMVEGSPVWVPSPDEMEAILVAQKDGPHAAVKVKPGAGGMTAGWPLAALGAVDERDLAWILKRLVFLGSAMCNVGLSVPDLGGRVMVRPSTHQVGVASFAGAEVMDEVDETHDPMAGLMDAFSVLAAESKGRGVRKLLAFAEGCKVASRPDGSDLMRELDDVLLDLYGARSYHEMEDPASH